MFGYIDGYDFGEMDAMKYYAPPSSWSDTKKKDTARNRIFSGEFWGARKMDGYFAKIIKDEDGNCIIYSRSRGVSGDYTNKVDWMPQLAPFWNALPKGTCLLGEIYLPSAPGSRNITTLMGCLVDKALARQESGERLHLYVFDCLAYNGKSMIDAGAKTRFDCLPSIEAISKCKYTSYARYYNGEVLWGKLQEILAEGGEGIVITHQDAHYEPGKRPSKTTLKIKQELKQTIDCFFTGRTSSPTHEYTGKELENWTYWENIKTGKKMNETLYREYCKGAPIMPITKGWYYDWAGSLEIGVLADAPGHSTKINGKVYENCVIQSLGWLSGLTEEVKSNAADYMGRCIEVSAMSFDMTTAALRHGKMIGWRDDLTVEDCTWDKIVGLCQD